MTIVSKWGVGCAAALLFITGLSMRLPIAVAAQSDLVEIVPSGPDMPPVAPGKSPWGRGVQLAAAFLGWLNDQAVKSAIQAKVDSLNSQINAAMPQVGGVLVVIGVQQSVQPDNNGNYFRSVLDGYIGGSGRTPKATMDAYLAQDRLEAAPPAGFVRRNVYFWKPASSSNSKKRPSK